jgi:hypothetical protein
MPRRPSKSRKTATLGELVSAAFDATEKLTRHPGLAAELATWLVAHAIIATGNLHAARELAASID